jgi:hypothetical protein
MTEQEMRDLLQSTEAVIAQLRVGCAELDRGLRNQDYDLLYSRAHIMMLAAERALHALNEKYALDAKE